MFGARKILGLAFEDGAVQVAELRDGRPLPEVTRAARFVPPADAGIGEPARMAAALREFLDREAFTARRAVIGLPASWLMSREYSIPPAAGEALVGILRLRAERAFSSPPSELSVDFADRVDAEGARPVLIVASLRSRLSQVLAAAEGAGLKVLSVTASALAPAADGVLPDSPLVLLRGTPEGWECALFSRRQPRLLKSLAAGTVAEQVRRLLALQPNDAWWSGPEAVWTIDWDGAGTGPADLARRLDLPEASAVDAAAALGVQGIDRAAGFGTAVALARAGLSQVDPPVDFLHTHLTPRVKTGSTRTIAWAAILCATALLAVLAFVLDWRAEARQVAESRRWLEEMKDDIAAAERLIDRTASARGWYDRRPPFLEALREVTLTFPERGTVWATSVGIKENMEGSVIGMAADERSVLDVLDRLKGSEAMTDLQFRYLREAQAGGRDVAFSLNYTYTGTE